MTNANPDFKAGVIVTRLDNLGDKIAELKDWATNHDRMEDGWHARIERHLAVSEQRGTVTDQRIERLEADVHRLAQAVEGLKLRFYAIAGAMAVLGPILTLAAQVVLRRAFP